MPTPKLQEPAWRNRVTSHGYIDPTKLLANPKNWRIHPESQKAALAAVLDQVGWVQSAAIVNERTGFVVDGHLRIALAIARNVASVPVGYVDLTDAEEDLVLASFDSIGGAAVMDSEKLSALLGGLQFADPALDSLFADLMTEGEKVNLTNVSETGDEGAGAPKAPVSHPAIKPVLFAEEVATFESALLLTGLINRGGALVAVCQYYLDNAGH